EIRGFLLRQQRYAGFTRPNCPFFLCVQMEEGYELDLTYVTERIIAVSFPQSCSEETYLHNLKDVTRMLKSKHADNYLVINLSEKRHDLTKMNPKTLDTGWPDLHAPPLDKICTICKAMENWLNADPLHVVVIHCRGGKGRIGVVISSFVHFTDISASADQALDRFAMRKFYDDKVSALMTPSQKRYVWVLNSLLSGTMKMNASPLFLHCIILHGIPNFDNSGVCRPYIKVYQGMQAVYSSGVKCFHKGSPSQREIVFRLQFHTGAVQDYSLMFEKEDMEHANRDPRFPDYGKVELVFSEGPERIQGISNGADVSVDYSATESLTRWDSYQDICNGEAPSLQPQVSTLDKFSPKRSQGGSVTLGRPTRTTSVTSSPEHSDHGLSASSDSGLSSTSLWTERGPVSGGRSAGPSQQEKVELNRLLSGFGLDEPQTEDCMEPSSTSQGALHHQTVHANGNIRPKDRETDILDDEVMMSGHDLRSVDSLGTLSSSYHKSSQNSLLSDGFCSPGGGEDAPHHVPATMEEYERACAEARRSCLAKRTVSLPVTTTPILGSKVLQFRQGSYSTQTWVRQQQMVAAPHYSYLPEEGGVEESFHGDKQETLPKMTNNDKAGSNSRTSNPKESLSQVSEKSHDEEFNSLTVDIDNSIDQLNQLILDLDPTFVPIPTRTSSVKRNGGPATAAHNNNSMTLRLNENNRSQQPGKMEKSFWGSFSKARPPLYRADSVEYRGPGAGLDSGVDTGSDITPPTPAFPVSPPTPYGKTYTLIMELSSPRGIQRTRAAQYSLSRSPVLSEPDGFSPPSEASGLVPEGDGLNYQFQQPPLPEKRRTSDCERSLGSVSPAPSGFSSPHSGSSLSIPFPNVLPELQGRSSVGPPSPLPGKQVTVKFVQDTSKYWYKPDISRDQAIIVLKDKEPGCFIVRDSHSFRGAYGLAMKVATPPPSVLQQSKKGGDMSNELVRHFLIECTPKGVRLKGCPNEPYFGSLTALVYQHSITPLALPCKLIIPDRDPLEDAVETSSQSITNSAAELLKQGAACNVWFLGSVEMESLTGFQAVQKATTDVLSLESLPTSTVVHFKVSSQGITLTDNQRKLFFRRHYAVSSVIFCALDPQERKIFGFVARKSGSAMDNVCHLFAEHDPEQPASAIVNFVSKVMIGSQKNA
uniref:Tensin 3 n=1 Tax=Pygocentrus nattereri TaxID=42514 RepID=A0AAR2M0A6_PYGNA